MAVAIWLSAAAEAANLPPLPVRNTGWTWTATMSALGAFFGGGSLWAVLRAIGIFQKNANDRAKDVDTRDGARWAELMALNKTMAERIDALEKAGAEQSRQFLSDMAEERKRCDAEVAELRKDHASEVAEIRKELAGVYRMISSANSASVRMFAPREDLPDDIKERMRNLEQGRKLDRSDG